MKSITIKARREETSATSEFSLEVQICHQPNFGTEKYMALLEGEIIANGETEEKCRENALRELKRCYNLQHYGVETLAEYYEQAKARREKWALEHPGYASSNVGR